jgi:Protein of unknown function (DUF3106)
MIVRFVILSLVFAALSGANAAEAPVVPPMPRSPIEDFRRWLEMSPADREKELSAYSEAKREVLQRKLQAYEQMPAAERDYRLRALELRWYLQPLLNTEPAERGNYLNIVPQRLHAAVTNRLSRWDALDAAARQEMFADESRRQLVTGYFTQPRRAPFPPVPPAPVPPGLDRHFKRWENNSPTRLAFHLSNFFEMGKEDQLKALNYFSETERGEIQKTLDAFARLSPADRQKCVQSFQRFATMSREERSIFLRNAARWQQLTPEERDTWRDLVTKLPPMPPEPVLTPPLPRANTAGNDELAGTN